MREIYKSLTGETLTKLSPHCETSTPFDETLRALLRVSDTPVTCNDSQLPKVTAKGFAKVDLKWLSSEVKKRGREGGCFPRLLRTQASFNRPVVRCSAALDGVRCFHSFTLYSWSSQYTTYTLRRSVTQVKSTSSLRDSRPRGTSL